MKARCTRGHFLPAAAQPHSPCACTLTPRSRPHDHADLWGQGLTKRQVHTIRTVQLTGSYL
jgi:hypothetical protein